MAWLIKELLAGESGTVKEESDPTVKDWAKADKKPTYTADEVGALPSDTKIPTKTSDIKNDSGFVTAELLQVVEGKASYASSHVDSISNLSGEGYTGSALETKIKQIGTGGGGTSEPTLKVGDHEVVRYLGNGMYNAGEFGFWGSAQSPSSKYECQYEWEALLVDEEVKKCYVPGSFTAIQYCTSNDGFVPAINVNGQELFEYGGWEYFLGNCGVTVPEDFTMDPGVKILNCPCYFLEGDPDSINSDPTSYKDGVYYRCEDGKFYGYDNRDGNAGMFPGDILIYDSAEYTHNY